MRTWECDTCLWQRCHGSQSCCCAGSAQLAARLQVFCQLVHHVRLQHGCWHHPVRIPDLQAAQVEQSTMLSSRDGGASQDGSLQQKSYRQQQLCSGLVIVTGAKVIDDGGRCQLWVLTAEVWHLLAWHGVWYLDEVHMHGQGACTCTPTRTRRSRKSLLSM